MGERIILGQSSNASSRNYIDSHSAEDADLLLPKDEHSQIRNLIARDIDHAVGDSTKAIGEEWGDTSQNKTIEQLSNEDIKNVTDSYIKNSIEDVFGGDHLDIIKSEQDVLLDFLNLNLGGLYQSVASQSEGKNIVWPSFKQLDFCVKLCGLFYNRQRVSSLILKRKREPRLFSEESSSFLTTAIKFLEDIGEAYELISPNTKSLSAQGFQQTIESDGLQIYSYWMSCAPNTVASYASAWVESSKAQTLPVGKGACHSLFQQTLKITNHRIAEL